MDHLLQDLRYGVRSLLRQPSFTTVAVLTLALGIGATTAIFSVVYGILLRPLPYPQPDRLMAIAEINRRGTLSRLADPNFVDFRDQSRSFVAMAKYRNGVTSVSGRGEPTRAGIAFVTRDFFAVFGVHPIAGRTFSAEEAHPGAAPVLVASARYWKEHLGATHDLDAVKLRIQDHVYSVVGVLPDDFDFPAKTDLWLAAELSPDNPSRTSHNYLAVGRLREGVTAQQANLDLASIADRIVRGSPEQNDYLLKSAAAIPLQESLTGRVRSPLYVLLGAVGFLLLVACANVANLLLAHASKRARELAVRNALGASRGRLVQQFITETFVLAAASGAAGVLLAIALLRWLVAVAPPDLPRLAEVGVNRPVLAFTGAICVTVAVGLGLFTALRASSGTPRATLVEAGRGTAGGQRTQRVGRAIVATQLAMTLALLTGASLLGRSLLRVLSVDPGFRVDNVLTMDVQLPEGERSRQSQALARLMERLHGVPGVQQVAVANAVPMDEGGLPDGMYLEVSPQENPKNFDEYSVLAKQLARRGTADFGAVSPEYFQALGIPLRRGRVFDDRDGLDAPHVAVVSESMARSRWPNQDPIGRTIQFGNMDGDLHLLTVVGVVGDTHEYGPEKPPRPTVYVNVLQRPRTSVGVIIHTDADVAQVVGAARAILREELPEVPPRVRTFTQIYQDTLGSRRFNLTLVATFAGAALLLAIAGVYGVVAYGVGQRTQEIGVRMALGARPADVLQMILTQGMTTAVVGVAIGVIGSVVTARTIQSLLFGVEPTDPLVFALVPLTLLLTVAAATAVPALRATRIDPNLALRAE